MDWCENANSKCIFAQLHTIALDLAAKKRLAASFFFTGGKKDITQSLSHVLLYDCCPACKQFASTYSGHPFLTSSTRITGTMDLNSLKKAPTQSIQLVVIIDALTAQHARYQDFPYQ